MTDTAQQSQQAEQDARAAQGAAAEAESLAEQERKRQQREIEDKAFLTRQQQRADYQTRFADKDVTKFSTAETLQQLFGADVGAVEFLVGVMNIGGVEQNKKAPNVFELKTVGGNVVSFIRSEQGEFFGLTAKQAKTTPMTDALADDIMVSIQATGKTHIALVGSIAEKEIMWQAAQDHGLVVVGFTPRQELVDSYNARKEAAPAAGAQPVSNVPATPSSFMGNKNDNVQDAEREDVKPEAAARAPGKFLNGPEKPAVLLPPPSDSNRPPKL